MSTEIPDKEGYQVNRRRMCWLALGIMTVTVAAVLINPARYLEVVRELDFMFYSLGGLVAVYFGGTSYTQAKK